MSATNQTQEPRRRRGRPSGSAKPAESLKSATIRMRATPAQRAKFYRLGGYAWLRAYLDRALI